MHYSEIGLTNPKKKYFIVHHGNGIGWHFLDWSIKYLSNDTKNFLFQNQEYQELISNPIGTSQAHNHKITFVYSKEQLIEYNLIADSVNRDCSTIVLQNGIATHTINGKNGSKENLKNLSPSERLQLAQITNDSIVELTKLAINLGFTVISIHLSNCHQLVPAYQSRQGYDFDTGEMLNNNEDINDLWIKTFFSDTTDKFDSNIWDKREQIALSMRPLVPIAITNIINEIPGVSSISTEDFWINGKKLFVGASETRQISWDKVYNQWKNLHDTLLSRDYWTILNCIVNNKSMSLLDYNLNLAKEAFIQHGLIYKYNLNLKNWNLSKFPENTTDLHQLLEPNFHEIDKEYCKNF